MSLRAATLNVWALPPPVGHRVRSRMHRIGDRVASLDLDVVAFQEVWTGPARHRLERAARRAGLRYLWRGHDGVAGGGLLVASRFPIDEARFEPYALPFVPTRPDHPDYWGGKGFATLRLHTPDGPLRVVNTHLQARYSGDVPHQYRAYRVAQVVQLVESLRGRHEPILLLGDFNFRQRDNEYRILTGLTGLRDAALEAGTPEPTIFPGNAFRSGCRPKRIDYLFLRDGAERAVHAARVERVFDEDIELHGQRAAYSDHAGLLAEVTLADGGASTAPADGEAAALARRLLAEGRAWSASQRAHDRRAAGAGWTGALLAMAAARNTRLSRRRLLQRSVQGLGLLALTPAVAYTVCSEVYAPDELRLYDRLSARLDRSLGEDPAGIA